MAETGQRKAREGREGQGGACERCDKKPGAMGPQLGAGRRQYGLLTSKFPPVSACSEAPLAGAAAHLLC